MAETVKIRYLGDDIPMALTHGKIYTVLSIDRDEDRTRKQDDYQIIDDTEIDYGFLLDDDEYEVVEGSLDSLPKERVATEHDAVFERLMKGEDAE